MIGLREWIPTKAWRSMVHVVMAAVGAAGCQSELRPIFPAVEPPMVWPPPPDTARIHYVGELVGESSLRESTTGLAAFGALFTGERVRVPFSKPAAVAVESERVFVADPAAPGGPAVHILDLADRSFRSIREASGKPLEGPIDVAVDQGTVAVADSMRGSVFLFDRNGRFIREIGAVMLERPASVCWRRRTGELLVLDAASHRCLVFDRDGEFIRAIGKRGTAPGDFNYPAGMCQISNAEQERIIIADSMNFRVQALDATGKPTLVIGRKGNAAGSFSMPRDVAVDSGGRLYVLDNQFENIQVFGQGGQLLMAFGQEGNELGQFSLPTGLFIDARDRIWVADSYNRRVQVFQYLPEARTETK
jgi:DNA-binding beta-propeller fold protein YncE